MINRNRALSRGTRILAIVLGSIGTALANPVLIPGTWESIGPQQSSGSEVWNVRVDPNNSNVIYACCSMDGLEKSTDGGSTWIDLPNSPRNWLTGLAIDPANSQHLYASGASGDGGFFESTDGGQNWVQLAPEDIGEFVVDPSDVKHILATHHYSPVDTVACIESTDGGNSWLIHHVNGIGGGGTKGIHFLSCPGLGIGNGKTWLISPEGGPMFRTSDGGATWATIDLGVGSPHGGDKTAYYTTQGVLYIAQNPVCVRSPDNGVTWQKLTMGNAMYECIVGDGNTLYTSNPEQANVPVLTSPENDAMTWTAGTQNFGRGPTDMVYDSKTHIMYGACRAYGIYALKVNDANTGMFLSNAVANPGTMFDNAATSVTFSIDASAQGSIAGVSINLTPVGGAAVAAMTKISAATYSITTTVQAGLTAGDKNLLVTATDDKGDTLFGSIKLTVLFHDAPVLVSLNKTVTVSSTQDPAYPGSAAVDGNAGTRWASGAGDPQWIYVDLGSEMLVDQVILIWEAAYASGYSIQVSNDATTWTDVYTTTTGNGGTDSIVIAPTSARYVRMYGTVRGTNYAYSLYEFEVFSPPAGASSAGAVHGTKSIAAASRPMLAVSPIVKGQGATACYDIRGRLIGSERPGRQAMVVVPATMSK